MQLLPSKKALTRSGKTRRQGGPPIWRNICESGHRCQSPPRPPLPCCKLQESLSGHLQALPASVLVQAALGSLPVMAKTQGTRSTIARVLTGQAASVADDVHPLNQAAALADDGSAAGDEQSGSHSDEAGYDPDDEPYEQPERARQEGASGASRRHKPKTSAARQKAETSTAARGNGQSNHKDGPSGSEMDDDYASDEAAAATTQPPNRNRPPSDCSPSQVWHFRTAPTYLRMTVTTQPQEPRAGASRHCAANCETQNGFDIAWREPRTGRPLTLS